MVWFAVIFGLIGCFGAFMGVINYLGGRKSRGVLKKLVALTDESKERDIELMRKIGENMERNKELIPYMKGMVESERKLETFINSPQVSNFIDVPKTRVANWSDILKEDVFVAGGPVRWSDLLKIEIVSPSQ